MEVQRGENPPAPDPQTAPTACLPTAPPAPATHTPRIRILSDTPDGWDPEAWATLLWPLRAVATSVVCDYTYTEADISIVPTDTPWEPRQHGLGTIELRKDRTFRVFADLPSNAKGGVQ